MGPGQRQVVLWEVVLMIRAEDLFYPSVHLNRVRKVFTPALPRFPPLLSSLSPFPQVPVVLPSFLRHLPHSWDFSRQLISYLPHPVLLPL